MKDNLLEFLLNLFEKTLSDLKENYDDLEANSELSLDKIESSIFMRDPKKDSMRLFSEIEQQKLTKASYKLMVKISTLNIISSEHLESICNQLLMSDSVLVGLEETKWIVRKVLSSTFNADELAFLDLVLYQKEEELILH